ncbi:MAG: SpoIIE family protein phosphatase [Peptococcales bacterium]
MKLVPEIGFAQLAKKDEELCGDRVEINRTPENAVIVLSDGLGSGVKANILATLTTKIAAKMIRHNVPVNDVVETIVSTLPTCRVRDLAYSTFTIVKIADNGQAHIVEYDAPPVLKISENMIVPITTSYRKVQGKIIGEASIGLKEGDILVLVSDGVTQAGLGGILPLGLGVDGLIFHLKENLKVKNSAQKIANEIIELCHAYYAQEAGDDTTAVVLKLRRSREAIVFTGPPIDETLDSKVVKEFINKKGIKIVCGGTTANIVARELNRPVLVNFDYVDSDIPPIAKIPGIDLVTEGILTLTKGLEYLENNSTSTGNLLDGSSLLVKKLLECDKITFMVGTKINPAHQNPGLPLPLGLRKSIVERWQKNLEDRGKIVEIIWF